MIISHKYKFLFIGLPFSASSAITKDLHDKYAGKPYLAKHSLYHEFKKVAETQELQYFVFAVLRNPMEIAITVYEKMKANSNLSFLGIVRSLSGVLFSMWYMYVVFLFRLFL